jgi:hypothetical protein
MGYYTRYKVRIVEGTMLNENNEPIKVQEDIEEAITNDMGNDYGNPFEDSCKWYDHEDDMKTVSKKHPTVVFLLTGEGEEQPDLWHKYFKNGKMQTARAIVTYEKFDENKLK